MHFKVQGIFDLVYAYVEQNSSRCGQHRDEINLTQIQAASNPLQHLQV